MADRFDLEEKIMRASWVLEDIRLLRDRYNQRDFTWDELDNFLMAMETIYQHRFDDLDDTMCQVFELNQYASEEVKAKRSLHIKAYTESQNNKVLQFNGKTPGLYSAQSPDQRAILVRIQAGPPTCSTMMYLGMVAN